MKGSPTHWTTLQKLIWLQALQGGGGGGEITTVTGVSPLLLVNALAHSIKSLTQYGKVEQPYPPTPSAPADVVCNNGALRYSPNLLDPSTSKIVIGEYYLQNGTITQSVNNWRTGLIPIVGGKTYAFWGRAKADNTISAYNRINWFDANGNNIYPRPSYTVDTVTVGTAPSNAAFAGLSCSCYNSAAAITRETFDLFNWEFAETSEEIPYTPYAEGGIYAGGTHPGKNLANVNEQTALVGYYISAQGAVTADPNNWVYQAFIRVKPNTQYTLSMSQSVYYVTISEYSTAEDSGFIVRKNGTTGANTSLTITTGETTNFIRFGTNVDMAAITLEEVLGINWQVEEGATATAYEPYTEIPYTPEVLTVSGKNLLDQSQNTPAKCINGSGQEFIVSGLYGHTAFIPVMPNTTYSWSGCGDVGGVTARRGVMYSGNSFSDFISSISGQNNDTGQFTTTADTRYVVLNVRTDKESQQLELGATVSTYEPYVTPQTVSVPMLLSVGDYKDTAEIINGLLTHKVGVFVSDGTANWVAQASTPNGFAVSIPGKLQSRTAVINSTHYAYNINTLPNIPDGCVMSFGTSAIGIKDSRFTTVEALNAEHAAHPVIFVYPLETATTEQTTAHALNSYEGTTIVEAATNVDPVELSAEYTAGAA